MPIRSVNVLSQMQECIKDQRYGRCRSRSKLPLQLQFWCSEGTCDLQICMAHVVISCCNKSFCTSNAFLYGTNPPASTRHPGQHRLLSSSCLSLFPPSGLSFSSPLAVRGTHVGPTIHIVSFPLWCALLPRFLFTHPLLLPESIGQLGQLPDSWLLAILPPQSHRCHVVHRGKGQIRFGNLIK